MIQPLISNNRFKSVAFGGLVGIVVISLGLVIAYQRYLVVVQQNQNETTQVLEIIEQNIEKTINEAYSAALLLALTVKEDGEVSDFENVGRSLVHELESVDVVQLVPGGVIRYVYPMEGNESVMGYDILEDPKTKNEVMKAAETRSIYFAGPFELKQGGLAVIGRLPVVIKDDLWGYSAVIVYFETLIKRSGIDNFSGRHAFQLSKINPNSGEEEFFLPEVKGMDFKNSANINFPEGDWVLYAHLKEGNGDLFNFYLISAISLLLGLITGYLFYDVLRKPEELERLLNEKSEELLQSREQFRKNSEVLTSVFESPNTMLIFSIDKEYKYLAFNKNHEAIVLSHGIKKEIKIGEPVLDGVPEVYRRFLKDKYDRSLNGESFEYVIEYPNAKGENRFWQNWFSPIIDKGEVVGITVFSSDITNRIDMEKELRKSEARYRTLISNTPFCIHEVNFEGKLTSINETGVKMFNMPSAEVFIGIDYPTLVGEEQSKKILPLFDEAKNGVYSEFEFSKDNRDFFSNFIPIKNELGEVTRIMGITEDITERKRSSELIQSSLREKTTLLSEIHHRVKNNLAIVSGLLELQKSEVNDERLSVYFNQSINRIISIAMVHELMYQTHDLSSVNVKDYLEMLIPAISATMQYSNKNVEFELEIKDYRLNINEAIPMGLMLNELITNSFKYAFDGDTGNKISICLSTESDRLYVKYSDNGKGFDAGIDFETPRNLGLNLIHSQLYQLEADYTVHTTDGFELEFSFTSHGKGPHSNF